MVQEFADEVCRGGEAANQMKPLVDKARGVGEKYHQWGTPVWRAGYDYIRWEETSLFAKARSRRSPTRRSGSARATCRASREASYVVVIQYGP